MFIKDNRRWNKPYSKGTTEIDGVRYPNTVWDDPTFRASQGITEIPDPQLPEGVSDETHYITHQDTEPYIVCTPKSAQQITQQNNAKLQQQIESEERNTMLPRVTREFMLGFTEAQFTPEQLALNVGYKRMKELDEKIKALRGQIVAVPTPVQS
jgi:hypothetical protein